MNWSVVLTTAANRREAGRITRRLLDLRLAGCVNVIPRVRSSYWWKGKIENSREWLLLIKSRSSLVKKIEAEIRRVSSYECPEVIALPIRQGSRAYLAWLGESLRPPRRRRKSSR